MHPTPPFLLNHILKCHIYTFLRVCHYFSEIGQYTRVIITHRSSGFIFFFFFGGQLLTQWLSIKKAFATLLWTKLSCNHSGFLTGSRRKIWNGRIHCLKFNLKCSEVNVAKAAEKIWTLRPELTRNDAIQSAPISRPDCKTLACLIESGES